MKILFFPSDLGGGFGHISRCLALAHEATNKGHSCAFVINNKKYEMKIKNHFNVFVSKIHHRRLLLLQLLRDKIFVNKSSNAPLFVEISSLDYQVVRDGLVSEKIIKKLLDQYVKIVKRFKPDVLIGDTNLLVWMLSKKVDIPLVQIVRYASHPETAELFWWKTEPEDLIRPDSSTLFNPLLKEIGLKKINGAEELLQGDLYIVPSIPEIEPIPEDEKTVHVGELTISRRNNENPSWLQEIDEQQPLVYITIGGGAGPVGNITFFSTIIEAFTDKPVQVVVSTSSKFNTMEFTTLPRNIRFFSWVPGKLLISKADLVIFHGGYSTMMESVSCGKPTIIIPFQTEQEGNGRRLEQLGCGHVIKLSREEYKKREHKWGYGTYSFLIQNRYDLFPENLYGKVDKVLNDKKYLINAQNLQSKIKQYLGPKKTIELIEKYWS